MLNGLPVLFCPFDRRNPRCARLVDQLPHVFARAIKFAHIFHTQSFNNNNNNNVLCVYTVFSVYLK